MTLRQVVYISSALLWLSGCLWLSLHFGFEPRTDFGPAPHPWEPAVLRVHGWIAVCSVFLLGWVTAAHVTDHWRGARKRGSGLSLAAVALILIVTGYALYYTTDHLHDLAAAAHEVLGAGAIAFALTHWRRLVRLRPAR